MYGPGAPASSMSSSRRMRSQAASSTGYMATALPLAERDAYFAFRMSTASREPRNLKETPRGTQYCHTRVMTSSELSRHVDTWIFQPCAGADGPGGMLISQSPWDARLQSLGSGRLEIGKRVSESR